MRAAKPFHIRSSNNLAVVTISVLRVAPIANRIDPAINLLYCEEQSAFGGMGWKGPAVFLCLIAMAKGVV